MPEIVPLVLVGWVIVCVALFWRLPGRDAALWAMIAGWLILPVAPFPTRSFAWPIGSGGTMHALAVPTVLLVNKATAIGLGCLAGAMIFDWPVLQRIRPSRLDLPIVLWCLTPIASTLANSLSLAEGLAQVRYLALAWGVPYLMGRAYLTDNESLERLGLALVPSALVVVPLCLIEFVLEPFLYTMVYGGHPYQLEGAKRPILYRPLVFFEHGNQLGMWVSSTAVSAVWLWRSGRLPVLGGIPAGVIAAGLAAVCLVCQSHGSIALMAAVLIPLLLVGRLSRRPGPAHVGAVVAVLVLALTANLGEAASPGGIRDKLRGVFHDLGKQSFIWRGARYEQHLPRIAVRPILGWGRADWSAAPDHTFVNPVNLGLWLLELGRYGAVGLFVATLVLVLPVVVVATWLPLRAWLNPGCSGVALAAVLLLINTVDSLSNSEFLLPLLAAAGGTSSWAARRPEWR